MTMRPLLAVPFLLLPLAGCGFDRYDGRWVADVPPRANCCPVRVALDIDGHQVAGTAEDCNAVQPIRGKVSDQGSAALTVAGKPATAHFAGDNFETALPTDACGRKVVGNRGG